MVCRTSEVAEIGVWSEIILKIIYKIRGEITMELKVTAFVNVVVIVGILGLIVANV